MSERNSEAGDIPDVHRSLEQRLDGCERRHVLSKVLLARAGLELAGTELVEVAVGGHVGTGGPDDGYQGENQPVRHGGHHSLTSFNTITLPSYLFSFHPLSRSLALLLSIAVLRLTQLSWGRVFIVFTF